MMFNNVFQQNCRLTAARILAAREHKDDTSTRFEVACAVVQDMVLRGRLSTPRTVHMWIGYHRGVDRRLTSYVKVNHLVVCQGRYADGELASGTAPHAELGTNWPIERRMSAEVIGSWMWIGLSGTAARQHDSWIGADRVRLGRVTYVAGRAAVAHKLECGAGPTYWCSRDPSTGSLIARWQVLQTHRQSVG